MRVFAALTLGLGLAAASEAAVTHYLHRGASPVPIPGGSSVFFLDGTPPAGSTAVAEKIQVSKKTRIAFPDFIAGPFGGGTVLGAQLGALVHLSANLQMSQCASVTAQILAVDPTGAVKVAGSLLLAGATIPQGSGDGTTGFAPLTFGGPARCAFLDGIPVEEGGSVGLRLLVSNLCKANRAVSLVYDAVGAPSAISFDVLGLSPEEILERRLECQKDCAPDKIKAASKKISDIAKCFAKAVKDGVDPDCFFKAEIKFVTAFDKAEEKRDCVTVGDAGAVEGNVDAAVGAFVAALAPAMLPEESQKCAVAKIGLAAKKATAKLACQSKAVKKALPVDVECLTKAEERFAIAYQKLDGKGGCVTTGDAPGVEAIIDGLVDALVTMLAPLTPP